MAYIFWVGIALGSLAILMVIHLTGGAWGLVIRRPLEAATRTIPFMAILFIPIVIGMVASVSLDARGRRGRRSGVAWKAAVPQHARSS